MQGEIQVVVVVCRDPSQGRSGGSPAREQEGEDGDWCSHWVVLGSGRPQTQERQDGPFPQDEDGVKCGQPSADSHTSPFVLLASFP